MRYFLSELPKGPTLQIKPRQAHIRPNGADNHFIVCHFVDGRRAGYIVSTHKKLPGSGREVVGAS
jgi:hypothetical protein